MRKLLVDLAAAVLVVITAAIIIPFVIPVEAYKDRLGIIGLPVADA